MEVLLNWKIWLAVLGLSIVEVALGVGAYQVGKRGLPAVQSRFPRVSAERWSLIESWYGRWGPPILLLTALPVLNPLLLVTAGVAEIGLFTFVGWVFLAKLLRYWVVVVTFLQVSQRLT
jgi:membrane protein YqaA with SNARE-associated domain